MKSPPNPAIARNQDGLCLLAIIGMNACSDRQALWVVGLSKLELLYNRVISKVSDCLAYQKG